MVTDVECGRCGCRVMREEMVVAGCRMRDLLRTSLDARCCQWANAGWGLSVGESLDPSGVLVPSSAFVVPLVESALVGGGRRDIENPKVALACCVVAAAVAAAAVAAVVAAVAAAVAAVAVVVAVLVVINQVCVLGVASGLLPLMVMLVLSAN